ncbi:hypothetical protein DFH06DRAFT_1338071 [Mycena polygramma]|nr:hypothetical protein DFH06DRAFT_1338071 [Mycena polygramma]
MRLAGAIISRRIPKVPVPHPHPSLHWHPPFCIDDPSRLALRARPPLPVPLNTDVRIRVSFCYRQRKHYRTITSRVHLRCTASALPTQSTSNRPKHPPPRHQRPPGENKGACRDEQRQQRIANADDIIHAATGHEGNHASLSQAHQRHQRHQWLPQRPESKGRRRVRQPHSGIRNLLHDPPMPGRETETGSPRAYPWSPPAYTSREERNKKDSAGESHCTSEACEGEELNEKKRKGWGERERA